MPQTSASKQEALFRQRLEEAIDLLAAGELTEGSRLLMALYNEGYEQETIYRWLYEQSALPDKQTLDEIYEENRQRLSFACPQFPLPPRSYLFYQTFPLGTGDFALFDRRERRFIYENPDDLSFFHLRLQVDCLPQRPSPEEEELLQNTHLLYAEFANRLSALAGWIKQEKEKSAKTLYIHIPTPKNP